MDKTQERTKIDGSTVVVKVTVEQRQVLRMSGNVQIDGRMYMMCAYF
jgi:hypothetical protein